RPTSKTDRSRVCLRGARRGLRSIASRALTAAARDRPPADPWSCADLSQPAPFRAGSLTVPTWLWLQHCPEWVISNHRKFSETRLHTGLNLDLRTAQGAGALPAHRQGRLAGGGVLAGAGRHRAGSGEGRSGTRTS